MNVAFETFDTSGATLILPGPNSWRRGTRDGSSQLPTQGGGVDMTPFVYADGRYSSFSWEELPDSYLVKLISLAESREAHILTDLSGARAYVVFSAPEYSMTPGLPGYNQVTIEVDYVWEAGYSSELRPRPALPTLMTRGKYTPLWKETGGLRSLFFVESVLPTSGAQGVNTTADVVLTFSIDIEPESLNDSCLEVQDSKGREAGGAWTVSGKEARFKTPFGLLPGETYKVLVRKGKSNLRGKNGWWIADDFQSSFTTDLRGEVVANSLSYTGVNFTIKELPGNLFWGSAFLGTLQVEMELLFDDDLVAGESAVKVMFQDEFSNLEGPVKVLERKRDGNRIYLRMTVGMFGKLTLQVNSGTVGPVGKRRGQMAKPITVEYDVTPQFQRFIKRHYPQIRIVLGSYYIPGKFAVQQGYFHPDIPDPADYPNEADYPMADFEMYMVEVATASLFHFKQPKFNGSGQLEKIPGLTSHQNELYASAPRAVVTPAPQLWNKKHYDKSADANSTPLTANETLSLKGFTQITKGTLTVEFNVPLLTASVPNDAVQVIGPQGPIIASGSIVSGKLEIKVNGHKASDIYTVYVKPGDWLAGERGFLFQKDTRIQFDVGTSDAEAILPDIPQLTFDVAGDLNTPLPAGGSFDLIFNAALSSLEGVKLLERTPSGVETDASHLLQLAGNRVTAQALGSNRIYRLELQGGPDGMRGSGGEMSSLERYTQTVSTGYSGADLPPPNGSPGFLDSYSTYAVWDFQNGPVFPARPGPWPLSGTAQASGQEFHNRAYRLSQGPLNGGQDIGCFELVPGATVSLLVKGGTLSVRSDKFSLTHNGSTLSVQLRMWQGQNMGLDQTFEVSALPDDRWSLLAFSYHVASNVLTVRSGAQVFFRTVELSAMPELSGSCVIQGSSQLSELIINNSSVPMNVLEDYYGV